MSFQSIDLEGVGRLDSDNDRALVSIGTKTPIYKRVSDPKQFPIWTYRSEMAPVTLDIERNPRGRVFINKWLWMIGRP